VRQPPSHGQWTPAEEKQLRQLRKNGVSLDEIAKILHRSYSVVGRKCRAMGLTNPTVHRVAPSPKAALAAERHPDATKRAPKTTLPPLPSLRDE
jgi:hypothetical protein